MQKLQPEQALLTRYISALIWKKVRSAEKHLNAFEFNLQRFFCKRQSKEPRI